MLSIELTAIDLVLVIAVIVLLILYLTKFAVKSREEEVFRRPIAKDLSPERLASTPQTDYAECPRGFGNIRKLGEDNSVSDRCLGCYRIVECYSEH